MFPHSTIFGPLFWIIFGALQVIVIMGINEWAKHFKVEMTWWKTAICYGWFAGLLLTIAGGYTLHGEFEGAAGWYFIGFFGVIEIILGAILIKLFILPKKNSQTV